MFKSVETGQGGYPLRYAPQFRPQFIGSMLLKWCKSSKYCPQIRVESAGISQRPDKCKNVENSDKPWNGRPHR